MWIYLCRYKNIKHNEDYVLWSNDTVIFSRFIDSRKSKYYTELEPVKFKGSLDKAKIEYGAENQIVSIDLITSITKYTGQSEFMTDTTLNFTMSMREYRCITTKESMIRDSCMRENKNIINTYMVSSKKLKEALEVYNFDTYMSGFLPEWYNVDTLQLFLENFGELLRCE